MLYKLIKACPILLLLFCIFSCSKNARQYADIKTGLNYCDSGKKFKYLVNTSEDQIITAIILKKSIVNGQYTETTEVIENLKPAQRHSLGCANTDSISYDIAHTYFYQSINQTQQSVVFKTYILPLTGIFLTGIITFWVTRLITQRERKRISKKEFFILIRELADIERHCTQNIEIINKLHLANAIPSVLFFKRMKVLQYDTIFSEHTARALPENVVKTFIRLRLAIRNVNIELDTLIDYISGQHIRSSVVTDYVQFVRMKQRYLIDKVRLERKIVTLEMFSWKHPTHWIIFMLLKCISKWSLKRNLKGKGQENSATIKWLIRNNRLIGYLVHNPDCIDHLRKNLVFRNNPPSNPERNRPDYILYDKQYNNKG